METLELPEVEKYNIKVTMSKKDTSNTFSGVTDKVMATVNGEKVLIKGDKCSPKEAIAEYVAYRLGEAIGLNINKVKLIDCGDLLGLAKICSVHWWEDKLIIARNVERHFSETEDIISKFFDSIIDNDDRNKGNYGLLNNELFLIDHGLAHPWNKFDESEFSHNFKRAVKDSYCLIYVENFILLSEDTINDFVNLPSELDHSFEDELFNRILKRIFDAQKYVKELLKSYREENVA